MEANRSREPWNKGKLVGQKPPFKPKDIWAIPIYLQNQQCRSVCIYEGLPKTALLGAIVVLLWAILNKLNAIEERLGGIAYSVMPDRLK